MRFVRTGLSLSNCNFQRAPTSADFCAILPSPQPEPRSRLKLVFSRTFDARFPKVSESAPSEIAKTSRNHERNQYPLLGPADFWSFEACFSVVSKVRRCSQTVAVQELV